MPRDVETRWNYTYEMLSFAHTYRAAYNEITANRDMGMRALELSIEDWKIVKDLADVLKVSKRCRTRQHCTHELDRYLRMQHCSFRVRRQILQRSFRPWTISTNI